MTPEQLKASILQYAMEGKLVKQDPNDEPASELLKKIEEKKSRLVKEGKIKKSRKLSAIPNDEKSFDIPNNWKWVRLGEIGIITSGGTPRKAETSYWEDADIPWITPAIMSKAQNNVFFDNDSVGKINQKGLNNSSAQLISANSIVVSSRAPIGYINIVPFDYTTNQGCKSISTFSEIDNKYIYYAIKFSVPDMYKRASGTTFKEISGTRFGETVIPLPPLEEQKRIVVKIEKLMPLVDEYAESYNRLQKIDNEFEDKLKQSVLQYAMEGKLVKQNPSDEPASELIKKIENEKAELVKEGKIKKSKKLPAITDDEKPFDIPDSWEWVRLGNIGDWGAGATPSRQHPEYYGGDVLWLKTGDLNDGVIQDTSEKITEAGVANSSVKVNQPGNILIAMYGATIGKLGIVGKTLVTNQACCGCTPFKGIYNLYLFYYLLSARNRLIELGSGGAQPNISKTKIENFIFPLPPLEEQKRIVTKIEKIMNSINNH
ncbi:restriction endonuclease subunit S [Lactobacillus crispatus]|uniref:restriction endonuclease subunit S n=1 Tax=Lactobacillus crispatus TaxID=47770 RepID=UPI000B5DA007|nr:restriction endonuclease subunit S [Lactobacillus crispatus]OXC24602.1 restriction endonuclease subunit S [Lactobacillus crispatus]OXC37016.1 restriction endonuclease subunit S [Lactobacillus crispatus]OXC43607.1 restriction endonuclease subunit S [Lactobacillus crispatus]